MEDMANNLSRHLEASITKTNTQVTCQAHPNFTLNKMCTICDQPMCHKCEGHKHGEDLEKKIMTFDDFKSKKFLPELKEYIRALMSKIRDLKEEKLERAKRMMSDLKESLENDKARVSEELGELERWKVEIQDEFKGVYREIENFGERQESEISEEISDSENNLNVLKNIEGTLGGITIESDLSQIYQEYLGFQQIKEEKKWNSMRDIDSDPYAYDCAMNEQALKSIADKQKIVTDLIEKIENLKGGVEANLRDIMAQKADLYKARKIYYKRPFTLDSILALTASSPRFTQYHIPTNTKQLHLFPKVAGKRIRLPFGADALPIPHAIIISGGRDIEGNFLSRTECIRIIGGKGIETEEVGTPEILSEMNFPRCHHNLAGVDERRIVCVGGEGSNGYLKECEILTLNKDKLNKWEKLPNLRHARSFPGVCSFDTEALYVFGGFDGQTVNSVETLHLGRGEDCTWTLLNLKPEQEFKWLWSYACIQNSINTILVFGGTNGAEEYSECYELDVHTAEIRVIENLRLEKPNHFYRRKPIIMEEKVYVYGFNMTLDAPSMPYIQSIKL